MKKREFIKSIGLAGLSIPLGGSAINSFSQNIPPMPNNELPDELYWSQIRKQYKLKPNFINLENGYYCFCPEPVLTAQINKLQDLNYNASFYMRKDMEKDLAELRQTVANFLELPVEETIFTRNTTESMDTVINGLDWKAGDEVIFATHEYGAMQDMLKQQAKRYKIVNKAISIPLDPETDEEIVSLYKNAITSKTKLILVSHIINITGQILPIRKICDMAHAKGVEVLVDGAHAIGHFDFKIKDLHCDYYGCSFHKWLSAPLGCGLLYVQKDKIKNLWPLFADMSFEETDIRKLMHHGTQPLHIDLSIPSAISFYQSIGAKIKEDRLRKLQNYWVDALRGKENIVINTPKDKQRSCAIANVGISHMEPSVLADTLLNEYKIWTVAIDHAGVRGCRITPNVYTSFAELDVFVNVVLELAANVKK